MQALQTNLDGKSKQYKDPAITNLFLMNNIHYMVRSVRRFVLYMLFDGWFKEEQACLVCMAFDALLRMLCCFQV